MTGTKQDGAGRCRRFPRATGRFWLGWLLTGVAIGPAPAATEVVLHHFAPPPKGANPESGVIRDAAGNLYGTTRYGGAADKGVVYKVDTTGRLRVLHSFTGGADGAYPIAGVTGDSAGNLYGTTAYGGAYDYGVVYKVDANGNFTVLHTFTGGADGGRPWAGVLRNSAGNLYGTTELGGAHHLGTLYRLDGNGTLTVLHSFGLMYDGRNPWAGVSRDASGNLYGTTSRGGTTGHGTVYKLDTAGRYSVLYNFTGGADDGGQPRAGVVPDSAGNLYGTTAYFGETGMGVLYKLDAAGNLTSLHRFTGGLDGAHPYAGVFRDSAGNLYGTTTYGGAAGQGVVYRLDANGDFTVLHDFSGGADGATPYAGVIRDSAGNLYGTTFSGGTAIAGVVYKIDAAGRQTARSFPAADGFRPVAGVIGDSAGNLYGTTLSGGAANMGAVYKRDAAGQETVLYSFTGGPDGGRPQAGVIRDSAGNLYGTTSAGGSADQGVVFKLDVTGHLTVLHSFTGGADGGQPYAGLIRDSAGNLYGTTLDGGAAGLGTVYKLDTAGQLTVLHSFTGPPAGGEPMAGVIRDSAGNLYGTTYYGGAAGYGTVYKLDAGGNMTVLYSFTGKPDGEFPNAGVILDADGNLFGTTLEGGEDNAGVVYRLDPSGNLTILYSFRGEEDGLGPQAAVIRDSDGNLYGTTTYGGLKIGHGAIGWGVVFKLDAAGQFTVLYTFTGGDDGSNPYAGVIRDSAGNLYGTAANAGKRSGGVLFKIKP